DHAIALPWFGSREYSQNSYRRDHLAAIARVRFSLAEAAAAVVYDQHREVERLTAELVGRLRRRFESQVQETGQPLLDRLDGEPMDGDDHRLLRRLSRSAATLAEEHGR
ncbi:MAG: hypothetical protein GY953_12865, partial [bacterium]|nr:hypothetical protein [bacterium]